MTLRQEESLARKIKTLKAVCPNCRDLGFGNKPIFIQEGATIFNPSKVYSCSHGHITTIIGFINGILHVCFGHDSEEFVNIDGTIEELPELIDTKDIVCHHMRDGQSCDAKLNAIDDFVLTYPDTANIKTKTRVGDIWDKNGVSPVRTGHYDNDGQYKETKSERSNRARLQRMRDRNTPIERHPGTRVDKPTDTTYGRRSKQEINPERLTGPK
jgi:hypothetical protein